MQEKKQSLIAFRHHVAALVKDGAFKAPEDPLIYAIKERQESEITHRIASWNQTLDHPNFGGKPWSTSLSHLSRIFYRDDILEADDYQYLFSVINTHCRGILLTQLASNNCDGYDIFGGVPNVWISKFLQSNEGHTFDSLRTNPSNFIFGSGKLVKLLSVHVPDPALAARIHLEIERSFTDKPRAQRFGVELHYLNSAFAGTWNAPSESDADSWIDHYEIVRELRKENAKEIVGKTQVTLIQNQIKNLAALDRVDDQVDPNLKMLEGYSEYRRARPEQLDRIAQTLAFSLSEDLDHLIGVLSQPASRAVLAFGKPENKGDGALIPGAMGRLTDALKTSRFVEEDKARQIMTRMVIVVLSINHKHVAPKEITEFLDKVKDMVDWNVVVASLNGKGRASLIDLMPDSKAFRAYLPRADRGRVLENDLGM